MIVESNGRFGANTMMFFIMNRYRARQVAFESVLQGSLGEGK